MKDKTVIVESQILNMLPVKYDVKCTVGTGLYFETIAELLTAGNAITSLLYEGLLVDDSNYGVTWQIYDVSGTWYARIYDGTFYVKAVITKSSEIPLVGYVIQGTTTADGTGLVQDDYVLIAGGIIPCLFGVYKVNASAAWTRHAIFDAAADKLTGVTFVAENGTNYANSQWRFTTLGAVTPSTLQSDYSVYPGDPATFLAYTWLNFNLLGSEHPIKAITSSASLARFDVNTTVDATSGDITALRYPYDHYPNQEYVVTKIDQGTNKVLYEYNSSFVTHVLLEQGDWVKIINPTNNSDGTDFIYLSNRINKVVVQAGVTSDGKLGIDVPAGYTIYWIKGTASGGSGDSTLDIGSASGLSDYAAAVDYAQDGTPTYTVLDSSAVTELWIQDGTGAWNGATLVFEMLIIKE